MPQSNLLNSYAEKFLTSLFLDFQECGHSYCVLRWGSQIWDGVGDIDVLVPQESICEFELVLEIAVRKFDMVLLYSSKNLEHNFYYLGFSQENNNSLGVIPLDVQTSLKETGGETITLSLVEGRLDTLKPIFELQSPYREALTLTRSVLAGKEISQDRWKNIHKAYRLDRENFNHAVELFSEPVNVRVFRHFCENMDVTAYSQLRRKVCNKTLRGKIYNVFTLVMKGCGKIKRYVIPANNSTIISVSDKKMSDFLRVNIIQINEHVNRNIYVQDALKETRSSDGGNYGALGRAYGKIQRLMESRVRSSKGCILLSFISNEEFSKPKLAPCESESKVWSGFHKGAHERAIYVSDTDAGFRIDYEILLSEQKKNPKNIIKNSLLCRSRELCAMSLYRILFLSNA